MNLSERLHIPAFREHGFTIRPASNGGWIIESNSDRLINQETGGAYTTTEDLLAALTEALLPDRVFVSDLSALVTALKRTHTALCAAVQANGGDPAEHEACVQAAKALAEIGEAVR